MWRPAFTLLRKVVLPSLRDNTLPKFFYSTKGRPRNSIAKITLLSASVGVVVGVGYSGYTHYKVNSEKRFKQTTSVTNEDFPLLKEPPQYNPQYKIINENDASNLQLVLFQYRTCPFCCKVRAYLDARGISYEIVEVDAVLRQAIKWSGYKKVPILLAKVDGGYQQLLDSTAIMSMLETYLLDKNLTLKNIVKFYPKMQYKQPDGKTSSEVANRYFVMNNAPMGDEKVKNAEMEEREWRQWADNVLVHTLSPNVYRTPAEALETFKWFEEAGGWKESFPAWECALMVYGGATAMWIIAKRLKARHNIADARRALYNAGNKWMDALKKKGTRFLGGDQPNLADISVYGVLSSIEGCEAFQDLRNHSDVGKWYDDMRNAIEKKRGKVLKVHGQI